MPIRYLLTWLACLAWALCGLLDFDALLPQFSSAAGWGWFSSLNELLGAMIVILGNFWLYGIVAIKAHSLAGGFSAVRKTNQTGTQSPAWYFSPLPDASPLLSVLLEALILAAPIIFGLLCFLAARFELDLALSDIDQASELTSMRWDFWMRNILSLLKLPHFFLACCCFCLAMRSHSAGLASPFILALSASAFALQPDGAVLSGQASGLNLFNGASIDLKTMFTLAIAAGVLAGLIRQLRALSRSALPLLSQPLLLVLLCTLPLSAILVSFGVWPLGPALQLGSSTLAIFATFMPDTHLLLPSLAAQYADTTGTAIWYIHLDLLGLSLGQAAAMFVTFLIWSATLVLWAWAALQCLRAARQAQA